MQRPSLVASDVDGTLLDSHFGVSARTRAALDRARAEGVSTVLVTGRPPRWVPHIAAAAGVTEYVVCCNGSALYHVGEDRVIGAELLEPEHLHSIATTLRTAAPGIAFAVERIGARALGPLLTPFIAEHDYVHPWEGDSGGACADSSEVLGTASVKLLARHTRMTSAEIIELARTVLGDSVDITYSTDDGLIEVAPAGVTKASGLAQVCGWLGVDAAEVIAFGDMPNDLPMLTWAGHGVAMANADPQVLAAANEVAASHLDDGVAQVLERWF